MTCCVTGHRPSGFPFKRKEDSDRYILYKLTLAAKVKELIDSGCDSFITGLAEGADLDFAWSVINLRDLHPEIKLEGAAPYRRAPSFYPTERDEVMAKCDKVTVLSERYYEGCMQRRNMYMVDKSDVVLAIWNGETKGGTWNTIAYARRLGKKIIYIMLYDF
ncbi:MAG: DUF1273 family protein [Clostridia bacterium]|nr:DUF1273 family protein [Clostridia bacterium]